MRFTGSPTSARPVEHWLLVAVLLSSLGLNAVGIDWGLPTDGRGSWSYDEIPPRDRGDTALGRHGGRYPPLHYDLLRVLYAPLRAARATGWLELDEVAEDTALRRIGRSLTVLLGVGAVYLVYRLARLLLISRRTAVLAAAIAALPVPFVRFAKTVNLDVPYTFWLALSLFFLLRATSGQRWRDHLAFGAAMALAICTKDQAAGFYLAVPALVVPALASVKRRAGEPRPWARALADPRPWASVTLALAIFAVVHRLPLGLDDFRDHLRVMFGKGSSGRNDYPATLAGQWGMATAALRQIAFSLGAPMAAAAAGGIVVAVVERRWRMLSLLTLPLGYYLTFMAPILHARVRWFIPAVLLLSLFAALGLARLLAWPRLPRWASGAAVAAALLYSLALPIRLDLRMLGDSRYAVESSLAANVLPGERWAAIARFSQLTVRGPEPIPWSRLERRGGYLLDRLAYDVLVVNRDDAAKSGAERSLEALDSGLWGYREVFRAGAGPGRGWPDWHGVSTVLVTVDPALSVYRRIPGRAAAPRAEPPPPGRGDRRGARNGEPPG